MIKLLNRLFSKKSLVTQEDPPRPSQDIVNKVEASKKAGPHWSFCPYLNKPCELGCECLRPPYIHYYDSGHQSCTKWNCEHPSKSKNYRLFVELMDKEDNYLSK